MVGAVTVVARLRTRIEAHQAALGLAYPWWLPIFGFAGNGLCALIGLAERHALLPPQPVAGALVLVLAPGVFDLARGRVPAWVHAAFVIGGTAWILTEPATVSSAIDFAPAVLAFLAAEITAKSPRTGIGVTTVSLALLLITASLGHLPGVWAHLLETLLGAAIGHLLYSQMRALAAERVALTRERERATLAERARIAREIHDLTAHSLTVTLLHVTGARRLLDEGDTAEAVLALTDAEHAGRRAMSDIRRTVGSRTRADDPAVPLPNAGDLPGLVAEVRRAGLQVEYDDRLGAGARRLDDAVSLGLYRIVQESLANAARHAPGTTARLSVSLCGDRLRACVRNKVSGSGRGDGTGSGLAGMAERAEHLGGTFSAGPDGGEWVVDLVLPAGAS